MKTYKELKEMMSFVGTGGFTSAADSKGPVAGYDLPFGGMIRRWYTAAKQTQKERKMDVNSAILERLEKVVDTLQENSVKMGQLLAVHNEKLDKQDRIDAVLFEKVEKLHECVEQRSREIKEGCERDIRLVDKRLRTLERKMWSIAGGIAVISFLVSPVGQRIIKGLSTPQTSVILEERRADNLGSSRQQIHQSGII